MTTKSNSKLREELEFRLLMAGVSEKDVQIAVNSMADYFATHSKQETTKALTELKEQMPEKKKAGFTDREALGDHQNYNLAITQVTTIVDKLIEELDE